MPVEMRCARFHVVMANATARPQPAGRSPTTIMSDGPSPRSLAKRSRVDPSQQAHLVRGHQAINSSQG